MQNEKGEADLHIWLGENFKETIMQTILKIRNNIV